MSSSLGRRITEMGGDEGSQPGESLAPKDPSEVDPERLVVTTSSQQGTSRRIHISGECAYQPAPGIARDPYQAELETLEPCGHCFGPDIKGYQSQDTSYYKAALQWSSDEDSEDNKA